VRFLTDPHIDQLRRPAGKFGGAVEEQHVAHHHLQSGRLRPNEASESGWQTNRERTNERSLELHIDLRQQGFDFGLRFGRVAFGAVDELQFLEVGEGGELRKSFIGQREAAEFELFELLEVGGEFQARVARVWSNP
jgi:hypothetical protein